MSTGLPHIGNLEMTDSGGRLSRWSRRKMKARRGRPEAEPEDREAQPATTREAEEPEAQLTPEEETEVLRKLDLPAPETLKPGDDFSRFLQQAVPNQIRRRALRLLWRSDPILANVDGLVDYGEDFTDAATVVENLKTVFIVGHGARPIETEEESPAPSSAAATAETEAEEETEEGPDSVQSEAEVEPEGIVRQDVQPQPLVEAHADDGGAEEAVLEAPEQPPLRAGIRRSMAFRFDTSRTD